MNPNKHSSFIFQDTERAVSNVTLASQNVIGYQNRHGYILAIQDSRQRYGKEVRLEDFQNIRQEFESDTDESEESDDDYP